MWNDCDIINATATPDELGQTPLPAPLHQRFTLGHVYITPGALDALETAGVAPGTLVERHACGDWGDLGAHDWRCNERALRDGSRVFSVYTIAEGARVWIITEVSRASTTLLLPSEY